MSNPDRVTVDYREPGWRPLRAARLRQAAAADEPCHRCGRPIDYTLPGNQTDGPTVDHLDPLAAGGPLLPALTDLAPAHMLCNATHGGQLGHAIAKRAAAQRHATVVAPVSSDGDDPRQAPGAPFPPKEWQRPNITLPFCANYRMRGENDGYPRQFPGPHPEAVGSLGDEAVEWIEARRRADRKARTPLRWWTWLCIHRLLEVRADGSWCWPLVFISASRQSGKSVLLTELAAWRCASWLFPEGQVVGHSASTVILSRKLQARLWQWAEAEGLDIKRHIGDSHIIWPDGSDWGTLAPGSMYGNTFDLALIDEAWCWRADEFWQATYPTMVERERAQAILFSAAHDEPRSLVASLLANPGVAVLQWGALPGDDFEDPQVWRDASPFWSRGREQAMQAARGEAGFAAQWLNVWPDLARRSTTEALLAEADWLAAGNPNVSTPAIVCAVEDRTGLEAAGAAAGMLPGGRILVWGQRFRDRDAALTWVALLNPAKLLLGASLAAEPMEGLRMEKQPMGQRETSAALPKLRELVAAGRLTHDGSRDLAEQVRTARVVERAGGLQIVSSGRSDVLRCAAWAVLDVSQAKRRPVWAVV